MAKIKRTPPPAKIDLAPAPKPWIGDLPVGLVVAILCVVMIWAVPRPIGDLYVAYAVGRDVLDGKLGKPDDWSFTTVGRVCINQNWGTHLLHYLTYEKFGEWGILGLKAIFVAAAALFVTLASRQRGAGWPVALIVAGGVIAAGRAYTDMRPNLTTLTIAPLVLWLLYKTRKNVHWIWLVMIIDGIWANMHGGFIFGLGLTGLWVGCRTLNSLIVEYRADIKAMLKAVAVRVWPLWGATIGAILLATFANPYGTVSLLFPLKIVDPAWKKLNEWQPLLPDRPINFGTTWAKYSTTWEFFAVMGILAFLLLIHLFAWLVIRSTKPPQDRPIGKGDFEPATTTLFDFVLAGVVVYMTFTARRFVPLSVIMVGPFLASHLQWLLGSLYKLRFRYLILLPAVALAIPVIVQCHDLYLFYRPDSPMQPAGETMYQRMCATAVQPVNAAEFLAANNISGRVINEWRWEGYLHWRCPQLKLFLGGRAHLVYDPSIDNLSQLIFSGRDTERILAANDVHLVVVPIGTQALQSALVERPNPNWSYIYFDGSDCVAADQNNPYTMELIRKAAAGELKYPTAFSAALSKATAMMTVRLKYPIADIVKAFMDAAEIKPYPVIYNIIFILAKNWDGGTAFCREYFRHEYDRLSKMNPNQAEGIVILRCRSMLAYFLGEQLYEGVEAMPWQQEEQKVKEEIIRMQEEWS